MKMKMSDQLARHVYENLGEFRLQRENPLGTRIETVADTLWRDLSGEHVEECYLYGLGERGRKALLRESSIDAVRKMLYKGLSSSQEDGEMNALTRVCDAAEWVDLMPGIFLGEDVRESVSYAKEVDENFVDVARKGLTEVVLIVAIDRFYVEMDRICELPYMS